MFPFARRTSLVLLIVVASAISLSCTDDNGSGPDGASNATSGSGPGPTEIGPCATDEGPDATTSTTPPPTDGADPTIAPTGQAAIDANTYGQQFPEIYAGASVVDDGATVQVGFTADVEQHQAALDELLGEGTVTVVAMDFSVQELSELRDEVADQLVAEELALGAGLNLRDNLVTVDLAELDEESIAAVADAFPGEPLCVQ